MQILIKQLQDAGYQSLVFLPEHSNDIDTIVNRVLSYKVDLVVIFDARNTTKAAAKLVANDIPAVLFNRYIPRSNTSAVCCDDYQCGYMVAQEMCASGYQKFVYVAGHSNATTSNNRKSGFCAGLKDLGFDDCYLVQGGYTYEEGYSAGKTIIEQYPDADAVFCSNDITAIGVLDYLRSEAGISVPEQMGIVGFDDIPLAAYKAYQLTTVQQPLDQMIASTMAVIQNELSFPGAKPVHNIVEGQFIRRKTIR